MDERLDYYSSEEMLRTISSQWMVGHAGSTMSLERESSKLYLQYKSHHLHLVQKKETESKHINIPASKIERIAYYIQYTTSVCKTQIASMKTEDFNQIFWFYLFNVMLKTLPHTYVHVFLASYTPEDHLFVAKMAPLFYGFKLSMLMASFFEILNFMTSIVYHVGYVIHGVMNRFPWGRCIEDFVYVGARRNYTTKCCDIECFHITMNTSWKFGSRNYINSKGESFQLPQVAFYHRFNKYVAPTETRFVYLILAWTTVLLLHRFVTGKRFWKLLKRIQACIIGIEITIFAFIIQRSQDDDFVFIKSPSSKLTEALAFANVDLITETTTAPPVIHVLTARSEFEIHIHQDSLAIIAANAIMYIFRCLLMTRLSHYCQNLVRGPIRVSELNPFSFYYMWPIFYSSFFLGDLYYLIHLVLNLTIEMMTVIVTYHCFVETIISEWKWIRVWMVGFVSFSLLCCAYLALRFYTFMTFLIYSKCIVTLSEIIAIYAFYPMGRLVDDITFHTGQTPTKLMILAFRLMPLYYLTKISILFYIFITVMKKIKVFTWKDNYKWSWGLVIVPYALGAIYIFYLYIIEEKRGWQRMFVPMCNWGPQDTETKGLRKLYSSRDYIRSQALRSLSRYMQEKSEAKAFQLDLNYDPSRRSIATSLFRMESEKKLN